MSISRTDPFTFTFIYGYRATLRCRSECLESGSVHQSKAATTPCSRGRRRDLAFGLPDSRVNCCTDGTSSHSALILPEAFTFFPSRPVAESPRPSRRFSANACRRYACTTLARLRFVSQGASRYWKSQLLHELLWQASFVLLRSDL